MKLQMNGIDELIKKLNVEAPREAKNLARAVVHDVAGQMAKEVRAQTPIKTGNLRKSIKHKRHKPKKNGRFSSSVRANALKNSGKKGDAFYWKFVEFGTRTIKPRPFIKPIKVRYAGMMESIMKEAFFRKLEQKLKRAAK